MHTVCSTEPTKANTTEDDLLKRDWHEAGLLASSQVCIIWSSASVSASTKADVLVDYWSGALRWVLTLCHAILGVDIFKIRPYNAREKKPLSLS